MKKKLSFAIKTVLFGVMFFGIERFCHKQTRGFQIHKILSSKSLAREPVSTEIDKDKQEELVAILNQPFYFLSSGGQCYAFISQDGQNILKFFKNHHIRFWNLLNRLPLPKILETSRQRILQKHLHQSPQFFESCAIAGNELKERTGMIYLHLNRSDCFPKKLELYDPIGVQHHIDLNKIDFALQKKADFSKPLLKKLIHENNMDSAKKCIDSMIDLILERCQKGIADRDPNFRRNIGFINYQAIEIDIGSYSKDESLKDPEMIKLELLQKTDKLNLWLQKYCPLLADYCSEIIKTKIQFLENNNPY